MHRLLRQQLDQLGLTADQAPPADRWHALLRLVSDTYSAALDEAALRAPEGCMASLRHDFKTPLSSIRGFAAAMVEDPAMPLGTRSEFLQLIVQESDRLTRLIDDNLR